MWVFNMHPISFRCSPQTKYTFNLVLTNNSIVYMLRVLFVAFPYLIFVSVNFFKKHLCECKRRWWFPSIAMYVIIIVFVTLKQKRVVAQCMFHEYYKATTNVCVRGPYKVKHHNCACFVCVEKGGLPLDYHHTMSMRSLQTGTSRFYSQEQGHSCCRDRCL